MRIVSICPSNTEILYALGLIDQVIAIDDFSDWPSEHVKNIQKVGPDLNIDMETVAALAPDLVVASLSVPGMEKNIEKLELMRLPYVILNAKSMDEIFLDIRTVARLTNTETRGEKVISDLQDRLQTLAKRVKNRPSTPSLYWEWWPRPYISPAGDNWLAQISQWGGARNIFADQSGDSVVDPTGELIIKNNPDFILTVWCGIDSNKVDVQKIKDRPGWERITAVKKNQIHVLEEGLYCRPSQRLVDGLEQLVDLLHPILHR